MLNDSTVPCAKGNLDIPLTALVKWTNIGKSTPTENCSGHDDLSICGNSILKNATPTDVSFCDYFIPLNAKELFLYALSHELYSCSGNCCFSNSF
jgi:hypothetical protein